MPFFLHVEDGALSPLVYRIDQPCVLRVGRLASSDIALQNPAISRQHLLLDCRDDRIVVTDTHSLNRTYLNNEPLEAPVTIGVGDFLRLADVRIYVHDSPHLDEEAISWHTSPRVTISYLPGQGGNRKLRLIACAWFRRFLWPPLHEYDRYLIELAERGADGEEVPCSPQQNVFTVRMPTLPAHTELPSRLSNGFAREAVLSVLGATRALLPDDDTERLMCKIAQDVLGDFWHPFRPSQEWRHWHDNTLGRIARTMKATGDYSAMPILADALEDAGCQDELVLRHCREFPLHVHGCWVIDGLLSVPVEHRETAPDVTTLIPD
jgi:hypothetical protein